MTFTVWKPDVMVRARGGCGRAVARGDLQPNRSFAGAGGALRSLGARQEREILPKVFKHSNFASFVRCARGSPRVP